MAVAYLFDDECFLDPSIMKGTADAAAVQGWPEFANTVIRNPKTGVHKTNVNRFDALEVFTVNMALQTAENRAYLIKVWRGGYGSGVGLRVRVPWDYTATLEAFATGNGVTATFQLKKTYTRPGVTARQDVRAIVKPVVQVSKETNSFQLLEPDGASPRTPTTAFKIFFGGVEQATGWSVNAKTGLVTFSSPPANGTVIRWTGEFDVPMAFMGNTVSYKHDAVNEAQNVQFREIPPAELGIVI